MAALHRPCLLTLFLFLVISPSFGTQMNDSSVVLDKEEEPENLAAPEDGTPENSGGEAFGHGDGIAIDEQDVVVLSAQNFSDFITNNKYVMVEFYAPWCGHCQALAPEYAAAATELKDVQVPLAKVDATIDAELAEKYDVEGYPTLYFFMDGVHKPYSSHLSKDAIVSWVKKKTGPPVSEVTTSTDAEIVVETGKTVAVAFFEKLEGAEVEEFASAAREDDDVLFYQTANEDVAHIFNIKKGTKAPALVLLKNATEKISYYDGKFQKDAILDFIVANKLPLVSTFARETAALIFDSPIKKQLLLFVTTEDYATFFPIFEEAAKSFKGKIIFVRVDASDEVGKPILRYFGVNEDKPRVVGFTTVEEQAKKFMFRDEITVDNIKAFGEEFLADNLKQYYRSEPIPENDEGDVKIVVSAIFDDIVLDESKDVLLEIYAPWCGHCKTLEPVYNKLATGLRHVDSLVIAKMDGTANEHPRVQVEGFPTLLFFPAGNKTSDPVKVHHRTVVAISQFLKKNAAIPFTLPDITEPEPEPEITQPEERETESTSDDLHASSEVKDEL